MKIFSNFRSPVAVAKKQKKKRRKKRRKKKKKKKKRATPPGGLLGIKCVKKEAQHLHEKKKKKKKKKQDARGINMTDQQQQQMTPEQREQAFAMANQEMEYRVDLFNKLVHSCYEKCIDKRFKDGDLNVGETACVDRCSSKYWQSVGIVGQLLGANQQQQQQ